MESVAAGTVIADKYRLEGLIGRGSMGMVYRATQIALQRAVAVKLMHSPYALRSDSRARFVREARIAASFHHKNAAEIYDFGEHPPHLYLVMELLQGETARKILDRHPGGLPPQRAAALCSKVAEVLVAAHRISLVHRDIKPENVFVENIDDEEERVCVLDFGLAFIAGRPGTIGRLTQEGILCGTPAYLSPEQAQGQEVTSASDVYSTGCLLYELLTGEPPFGGTVPEVLAKHVYAVPTPLGESSSNTGAALNDLVMAMLAKNPGERPSAGDVLEGLEEIRDGRGPRADRLPNHLALESGRKVTAHNSPQVATPPLDPPGGEEPVRVAFVGEAEESLLLTLAANGVHAVCGVSAEGLAHVDVAYVNLASAPLVGELVAAGVPVVATAKAGDFAAVTELIRAGAAEVVRDPVRGEDLVRKLRRAAKKGR